MFEHIYNEKHRTRQFCDNNLTLMGDYSRLTPGITRR